MNAGPYENRLYLTISRSGRGMPSSDLQTLLDIIDPRLSTCLMFNNISMFHDATRLNSLLPKLLDEPDKAKLILPRSTRGNRD